MTNSRDTSDFKERDSLLTALLMPLLIGGKPNEEGCTINSHQDCSIDLFCLSTGRHDTIVTMPIASIPCVQFSIRSTAASNLRASARGGSRGTWTWDADRSGNHALMMQRRSYRRKEAYRPGREETPSTDSPVDLTRSNDLVKRERKKQRAHCTYTSYHCAICVASSCLLNSEQIARLTWLSRRQKTGLRTWSALPNHP